VTPLLGIFSGVSLPLRNIYRDVAPLRSPVGNERALRKMAEGNEMPFGVVGRVSQRNGVGPIRLCKLI